MMFDNLTHFDLLIVVLVGLAGLAGLMRGFCAEATSTFGWMLALWVMLKHSDKIEKLIAPHISEPGLRMIVATFILFLGVLVIAKLVGLILKTAVSVVGLGPFDRLLGFFFGIAKGMIIVGLAILAMDFTGYGQKFTKGSKLYPHFSSLGEMVWAFYHHDISKEIAKRTATLPDIDLSAIPEIKLN